MKKEKVALVKCTAYDQEAVDQAVDQAIRSVGDLDELIRPGMKVFLKVNLLMRKAPEHAVTTHPAVVRAVARQVLKRGAEVIIGDSPGGPYVNAYLQGIYQECGMTELAKEEGIHLNRQYETLKKAFPEGEMVREFIFAAAPFEADLIINLAKLKTHGYTGMTAAVKNLFGLIPGVEKATYHYRFPEIQEFSGMLVDIAQCAQPALHLVDGIVGMEGHGPSGGTPKALHAILAGTNPHAVDMIAAQLIGQKPEAIPTLQKAVARGLIEKDAVQIIGESLPDMACADFEFPSLKDPGKMLGNSPLANIAKKMIRTKPIVNGKGEHACTGCGTCMRACPPKAIVMEKGKPKFDYTACIRCYCCQELCPRTAVSVHRPLLLRIMS